MLIEVDVGKKSQQYPFYIIDTDEHIDDFIEFAMRAKIIGFDTEGTGLDPYQSKLLMLSFFICNKAFVFDLTKLDSSVFDKLRPIFENKHIVKVGQNLVHDWKMLYHSYGIIMENMFDIMIAEQMLYGGLDYVDNVKLKFNLKDIIIRRFNLTIDKSIRDTFTQWDEHTVFSNEQFEYATKDAIYPVLIMQQQLAEIEKKALQRISNLEMSILPPTAMMEYTGVAIDRPALESMIEPFQRFILAAEKAFQDILIDMGAADQILFTNDNYYVVNINSRDQVIAALNKIGINLDTLNSKKVQRWDMLQTRKRKKITEWEELDYHVLIDDDDVANALDVYFVLNNKILRAYTFVVGAKKLFSTYITGMLNAINPVTKRIHPSFLSYGARSTGRYSSVRPNFQNLPNDKKLVALGLGAYSIRQTLIASKDNKLIIADYSGIELLILAVLSDDKELLNEILRGDIHTSVASNVLGYTKLTKENKKKEPHKVWRDGAKRLSYAIAYGTTSRNVAETLNIDMASVGFKITQAEGQELIDKWFALYPKAAAYLKKNAEKAIREGFVVDVWGRRRNWDVSTFVDKWKRLAAMREAMNAPIQSTSATMTKIAIRLIWERIDRNKAHIILTVHDEIVVESKVIYADTASVIMKECMEQAIKETLEIVTEYIGLYEGTSVSPQQSDRYDK